MRRFVIASLFAGLVWAQGDPASWPDAEKEKFLTAAPIESSREIGHGVTKPIRATLAMNGVKHDAKVQRVSKELPDFFPPDKTRPVTMRDDWRFNIAAYRLDRMLGINSVPVSVQREFEGQAAALDWWVDNVWMEEVERRKQKLEPPDPAKHEHMLADGRVFDELILNIDRNLANLLITKDWRVVLIDHSRSFTPWAGIRNPDNVTSCSKQLLAAMKKLTVANVSEKMGAMLTPAEVKALIGRRDKIVALLAKRAAQLGPEKVYF
jgi:hypothetical protein